MTPTEPSLTGCVDLSPRTILKVTGEDRVRFLNGQLTNDIRLVNNETTLYSAVLNPKGQLDAVCHVHAADSAFLIDAPASLKDLLLARLDRYLIADDVTLTDVSEHWQLTHLIGISPNDPTLAIPEGSLSAQVNRYGITGSDLLAPSAWDIPARLKLSDLDVEAVRIFHGVPAWPKELKPGLLAPEAGLDKTAISYDKGCYLGQEVISRMKRAGKTNRHLVLLEVPAGTEASDFLHEEKTAGSITSVSTLAENDKVLALGFRSRKFEEVLEFQLPSNDKTVKVLRRLA